MGVRIRHKVLKDNLPNITLQLQNLDNRKVQVGALRGEHLWLASIHEYGAVIPVSKEMRAYLHSQGLHLKNSTTVIRIPERSFLRNGHDANIDKVMDKIDRRIAKALDGKENAELLLNAIGLFLANAIQNYMRDLSKPPNSSYTIMKKGSTSPLIHTSQLLQSIHWEVI